MLINKKILFLIYIIFEESEKTNFLFKKLLSQSNFIINILYILRISYIFNLMFSLLYFLNNFLNKKLKKFLFFHYFKRVDSND